MGVLVVLAALVAAGLAVRLQRRHVERTALAHHDLNLLVAAAAADLESLRRAVETLFLETLVHPHPGAEQSLRTAQDGLDVAAARLPACRRPSDFAAITTALRESRDAVTRGAAALAGEPAPAAAAPCFFNPLHGPACTRISWAPPGGDAAEIPVCAMDARRLAAGGVPDLRMLQRGHRLVPWFQAGDLYAPYAAGYYGSAATDGTFPDWSGLVQDEDAPRGRWRSDYQSAPDPQANGG